MQQPYCMPFCGILSLICELWYTAVVGIKFCILEWLRFQHNSNDTYSQDNARMAFRQISKCLDWPSQRRIRQWRGLKSAVHRHSPYNLIKLDYLAGRTERVSKFSCKRLVETYLKQFKAILAAKSVSNKH